MVNYLSKIIEQRIKIGTDYYLWLIIIGLNIVIKYDLSFFLNIEEINSVLLGVWYCEWKLEIKKGKK